MSERIDTYDGATVSDKTRRDRTLKISGHTGPGQATAPMLAFNRAEGEDHVRVNLSNGNGDVLVTTVDRVALLELTRLLEELCEQPVGLFGRLTDRS